MFLGGVRIPHLFPGEKMNFVSAARPAGNFEAFENAVLRNVASGAGLASFQVSNNWSDVNYSSARGALLEAWKTLDRRRHDFASGFAGPIRSAWLEEAMLEDDLPLPAGAPDYNGQVRLSRSREHRWAHQPREGSADDVSESKRCC